MKTLRFLNAALLFTCFAAHVRGDQVTHEVLVNFDRALTNPRTLALGPDGQYWGTSVRGGVADAGTVFKIHPDTGVITQVTDFTNTSGDRLGRSPNGHLYNDGLGFVWGTTNEGGINFGTVFKVEAATGALTTVAVFGQTAGADGQRPSSGLIPADGFLWGVTSSGPGGRGTVFKVNPATGAVTTVVIFTGTSGDFLGSSPVASLVSDGAGFLWGTTSSGGQVPVQGMFGNGTIFKIATATGAFTSVVSFTGEEGAAPGSSPSAALLPDGAGFLWGVTSQGGISGDPFVGARGTIFKMEMATGAVTTLFQFTETGVSSPEGRNPTSALIPDGAGNLWGTCGDGGASNRGTIFKFNLAAGTIDGVISFTGREGAVPGQYPQGLVQGVAGTLWGVTDAGGASNMGTIFKVNTVTPGHTLVKELDSNGTGFRGRFPHAALMAGADGRLWGSTREGGVKNQGTLFSFDTGTGAFTTQHEFLYDGLLPANLNFGAKPISALASDGAGFLWAGSQNGGASDRGTIFKIEETTGNLTVMKVLTGFPVPWNPAGPLIKIGDDFYGLSPQGNSGANLGTLFKVEIATGTTTILVDFTGTTGAFKGSEPYGALVDDGTGVLWGTTSRGGAGNHGTVFKYNPATEEFATVIEFTSNAAANKGRLPLAGLMDDGAGFLWGTTSDGGSNGLGTIFRISKTTEQLETIKQFTGNSSSATPGAIPRAPLIPDGVGYLWGTTYQGGAHNRGTVFRLKLNSLELESAVNFKGDGTGTGAGANPSYGGLFLHSDGKFYGTTENGGSGGAGTFFRVEVEEVPPEMTFSQEIYAVNQGASVVMLGIQRTGGTGATSVTLTLENGSATLVPPFAAGLAGTDYTALTGGQMTVDFAEGENERQVAVTLAPKTGKNQPNKHFRALLSNPAPGAIVGLIPEATVRILADDTTKPTLKLITPVAKVNAAQPYLVTGVAGDARGIAKVEISLNGSPSVPATLGASTKPAAVPFFLPVTIFQGPLLEGANTIQVTAHDLRGNITILTRSFNFVLRNRLIIRRDDYGRFVGFDPEPGRQMGTVQLKAVPSGNATRLQTHWQNADWLYSDTVDGTRVRLTAVPAKGYLFARWSGGSGNLKMFNILEYANLEGSTTVTAEFIRNRLFPPSGMSNLFAGVIRPKGATPVENDSHGWFSGTLVPATGVFTGQLHVAGLVRRFTASIAGDGVGWFHDGAARRDSITVGGWKFLLVFSANDQWIQVLSSKPGGLQCEGFAKRARYDGKVALPPQSLRNQASKGFFTVAFPPKAQTGMTANQFPNGSGFATLTLDLKGNVLMAGTLPDGSPLTSSAPLVAGDVLPVFCQLQTPGAKAGVKGGCFGGELMLSVDPDNGDVTGTDLFWFRPAVTQLTGTTPAARATQLYTEGWPGGILLDAAGALYDVKQSLQAMLDLLTVNEPGLILNGGKVNPEIQHLNFTVEGSKIVKNPANDPAYNIKTTLPKGGFNGFFIPNWPAPAKTHPAFRGILIQRGTLRGGYGFFISNALDDLDPESGHVFFGRNHN